MQRKYFVQARFYDAVNKRFIAPDTHWNQENRISPHITASGARGFVEAIRQSGNLYAYCMNSPVVYVDYSGDMALPAVGAAAGAGAGVVIGAIVAVTFIVAYSAYTVTVAAIKTPAGQNFIYGLERANLKQILARDNAGMQIMVESVALLFAMLNIYYNPDMTTNTTTSTSTSTTTYDTYSSDSYASTIANIEPGCTESEGSGETEHKVGEDGTQTPSTTTGKSGNAKERVDVENPAPGKRDGDIHYHEPDDTKWRYDLKNKNLVDPKSGSSAPPRVKKVLDQEWFKKALKKGLDILGE